MCECVCVGECCKLELQELGTAAYSRGLYRTQVGLSEILREDQAKVRQLKDQRRLW